MHVSDLKLADGITVVTQGKPNPVIVSTSVQAAEEEVVVAPRLLHPRARREKSKRSTTRNKSFFGRSVSPALAGLFFVLNPTSAGLCGCKPTGIIHTP
jgi:hypothetical protein